MSELVSINEKLFQEKRKSFKEEKELRKKECVCVCATCVIHIMGLGDCVRAAFPHPRQGEPGILVMSHLDTVHPVGTSAKDLAVRVEGDGIASTKGTLTD